MPAASLDQPFRAHPLLSTNQTSDLDRNFREMERLSKRPYSLSKVIRELAKQPLALSGFEAEVNQELKALTGDRQVLGTMLPMQALCRRDLTTSGMPSVQTSVGEDIIPFLRYRSVVGRLGGTMLNDLTGGPWRLPRATGTGGVTWQTETANVSNSEATFDQVTLTPSRISSNSIVSKQLVAQSQPDIEQFFNRRA
jgi:HK97 family phage major capsid protein